MKYHHAVLAALAVAGAACARSSSNSDAFDWSQQLPAGATVHLRDGNGGIDVRRAAGQTAHVTASTHWRRGRERDIDFVVTNVGANEYYICAMWRASGQCGESGYHGARTSSGFLTMFSLFHHGSDAVANFAVELPANVVVDASTVVGSVRIDGASAGVAAKVDNGTLVATNVSGPITLRTTNGGIRVSVDSLGPTDAVSVRATNGAINAQLPSTTQGAFDVGVTNGVVRTDFALSSDGSRRGNRHMRGQIGNSNRPITLRAVNGVIVLNGVGATPTVPAPAAPSVPSTTGATGPPAAPTPPPSRPAAKTR